MSILAVHGQKHVNFIDSGDFIWVNWPFKCAKKFNTSVKKYWGEQLSFTCTLRIMYDHPPPT